MAGSKSSSEWGTCVGANDVGKTRGTRDCLLATCSGVWQVAGRNVRI